jgi:hypothetical protein
MKIACVELVCFGLSFYVVRSFLLGRKWDLLTYFPFWCNTNEMIVVFQCIALNEFYSLRDVMIDRYEFIIIKQAYNVLKTHPVCVESIKTDRRSR